MEFSKLIEERRSIRAFDAGRKVSEDVVKEIIYAAIQAPSWKNSETERYYGEQSDETADRVRAECLRE